MQSAMQKYCTNESKVILCLIVNEEVEGAMKNKNKLIIVFIVCTLIIGVVACCIWKLKINKEENDSKYVMSRFEWISMLSEYMGIMDYENAVPYFEDVDSTNQYFANVQSAVEWGVLDQKEKFEGDKKASGKFIALTAMKSIGQEKVKLYLRKKDDTISEKKYIQLAIDYNLISKGDLNRYFSEEEGNSVLQKLEELYFGEFWIENYEDVKLKEGVKELKKDEVKYYDSENNVLKVQDDVSELFKENTILIFEDNSTGLKVAKKIIESKDENEYLLSDVTIDKVLDSLTVSDVESLTYEDIVQYYRVSEEISSQSSKTSFVSYSGDVSSKGFCIELASKEKSLNGKDVNVLDIVVKDHDTGKLCHLPIGNIEIGESKFNAKLDVNSIYIASQLEYTFKDGVTYADVALDANAVLEGTISNEWAAASKTKNITKQKILLCKTPIAIGNGWIGVTVDVYLVMEADGSIYIETQVPMQYSICYEKGKGVRSPIHSLDFDSPTIGANGSVKLAIRTEPTLSILSCIDILDAQFDVGAKTDAEIVRKSNNQVCADVDVCFPTFDIAICGDGASDTLLGKMGITKEWEIISKKNAPLKWGLHYEWLSDGTSQFVDKCTYETKQDTTNLSKNPNGWFATFSSPFEEEGDYYSTKGNIYAVDCITQKELEHLKTNDRCNINGKIFIFKGMIPLEQVVKGMSECDVWARDEPITELYEFTDENGNRCFCGMNFWGTADEYVMTYYEKDADNGGRGTFSLSVLKENYTFKIPKNTDVHIITDIKKYTKQGSEYGEVVGKDYTMEECVKEKITDYYGDRILQNTTEPVTIYFDIYENVWSIDTTFGVGFDGYIEKKSKWWTIADNN